MYQELEQLKNYIQILTKSEEVSCLMVCSPAGYGKTTTTINTLEKAGFKRDIHYIYSTSYITPLEFYHLLAKVNDLSKPKMLVLDDVEYILGDKKILGLLRSALWKLPNGKRQVDYTSSSYKVDKTQIENFTGRIIILLNKFREKNPVLEALKDRSIFYQFSPSKEEVWKSLKQLAEQPYSNISRRERLKIYDFLKHNAQKQVSFRLLIKAFEIYSINKKGWWDSVGAILK